MTPAANKPTRAERKRRIKRFTLLFLGLVRDLWKEGRLVRRMGMKSARMRMSARHRKRAIQFKETAAEMGGVLIKLGQFLSTRADVMPEEYLEELRELQDEVSPVDFSAIQGMLESEYGRPLSDIFASFDPVPLASASLGQAHRAVLFDGRPAVVKVQRPGIEELCDVDLATFAYLMEGVERFTKFGRRNDIKGIVREFVRSLGEELDFFREAHYAERFKKDFADDPTVTVPDIYWEFVTRRSIALEGIDGIKINDVDALDKAGYDRSDIARLVTESYLVQVIGKGFFHADPHPGNIFIVPGPTVCFIDFGMVGEVRPESREELKALVIAVAHRNADEAIRALSKLGFIRRGVNITAPRNALQWLFDEYGGMTRADVTFDALEDIQEDVRTMVYEQPFTLPSEFAFLARAISTMLGVATTLDPDFDLVDAAKPKLDELLKQTRENWPELIKNEAIEIGSHLIRMPAAIDGILSKLEKGELKVRTDSAEMLRVMRAGNRASRELPYAVLSGASIIGSVMLYTDGQTDIAYGVAGAAGLFLLMTLVAGRARAARH